MMVAAITESPVDSGMTSGNTGLEHGTTKLKLVTAYIGN